MSSNNGNSEGRFALEGSGPQDLVLSAGSGGPSLPTQGSVRVVPTVAAPEGVSAPPNARQLVVVAGDVSPSMNEPDSSGTQTKAAATIQATAELIAALKKSSLSGNFAIATIAWAERVLATTGPELLFSAAGNLDWNPATHGGKGTRCGTALEQAAPITRAYLEAASRERLPASVVILLLTDGKDAAPTEAVSAANELRSIEGVTVAACRFGASEEGDDLLRHIASEGFYQEVHNAEELRRFFMKSITDAGRRQVRPSEDR